MKIWLLTLSCLMLVSACGQLTQDQWNQLQGQTSASSAQQNTSPIANIQADFRGQADLQYIATKNLNSAGFTFYVTRANGTPVTKNVTLTAGDQAQLFQLMNDLFSGKVTIQSRLNCTQCTLTGNMVTNRQDASAQLYNYPILQNTTVVNPIETLNQYILNRL